MLIRVLIIPHEHKLPIVVREIAEELQTMSSIVGGHLEGLRLVNPLATMYLHEEGKFWKLPVNQRATFLAQRHAILFRYFVVGDVFIAGPHDASGNNTDCPPQYLELADGPRRDPR